MNNTPQVSRRHALQALSLPLLSPLAAWSQNSGLPLEQVKIINGFPAGGTADATSRRIGDKLAGTAYARNGQQGQAVLAIAERYALQGNMQNAAIQAKRAEDLLPRGSAARQRAQDILDAAKTP